MSSRVAAGSSSSEPWPGAIPARAGFELGTAGAGSRGRRPCHRRAGRITTVDPSITWSPEKSIRSSSSSQHRWFDACPGVCTARRAQSSASSRRSRRRPADRARSRRGPRSRSPRPPSAPPAPAAPGAWSGWVWVTTIVPDPAGPHARPGLESGRRRRPGHGRSRIDDHLAFVPDQVAVGARPGHHPGIGRRQADHPARTGPWAVPLRAPAEAPGRRAGTAQRGLGARCGRRCRCCGWRRTPRPGWSPRRRQPVPDMASS